MVDTNCTITKHQSFCLSLLFYNLHYRCTVVVISRGLRNGEVRNSYCFNPPHILLRYCHICCPPDTPPSVLPYMLCSSFTPPDVAIFIVFPLHPRLALPYWLSSTFTPLRCCHICHIYILSGRIGKVVASHAEVARSSPAEVVRIYTMHVALRGYCP